ncbi:hypothetical protein IWQ60_007399, partial [Tieghemiomyces parasiticus]
MGRCYNYQPQQTVAGVTALGSPEMIPADPIHVPFGSMSRYPPPVSRAVEPARTNSRRSEVIPRAYRRTPLLPVEPKIRTNLPRPLCRTTCQAYAHSLARLANNSTYCPDGDFKLTTSRLTRLATIFNLCEAPLPFGGHDHVNSCVNGLANERDTCGYGDLLSQCALCPSQMNTSTCLNLSLRGNLTDAASANLTTTTTKTRRPNPALEGLRHKNQELLIATIILGCILGLLLLSGLALLWKRRMARGAAQAESRMRSKDSGDGGSEGAPLTGEKLESNHGSSEPPYPPTSNLNFSVTDRAVEAFGILGDWFRRAGFRFKSGYTELRHRLDRPAATSGPSDKYRFNGMTGLPSELGLSLSEFPEAATYENILPERLLTDYRAPPSREEIGQQLIASRQDGDGHCVGVFSGGDGLETS